MRKKKTASKKIKLFALIAMGSAIGLLSPSKVTPVEATRVTSSHIGTFEGSTTFTTSSRNGINPGLFIEVMDDEGHLTQYESEDGVITIPNTQEGAYITQAKLLGKTKYVDEDTGEVLDAWEEGRNLRLASSENPTLTTTGKNLFDGTVKRGYVNDAGVIVPSADDWVYTSMMSVEKDKTYVLSVTPPFQGATGRHAYL